jgi:hypothetical protein
LACISARKAIWKATITTLPNTMIILERSRIRKTYMSILRSIGFFFVYKTYQASQYISLVIAVKAGTRCHRTFHAEPDLQL